MQNGSPIIISESGVEGLKIFQFMKNLHEFLQWYKRSQYKSMFVTPTSVGLKLTQISTNTISTLKSEKGLENEGLENALGFEAVIENIKEKDKKVI